MGEDLECNLYCLEAPKEWRAVQLGFLSSSNSKIMVKLK